MKAPSDHFPLERPPCTRSLRTHLIGVLVILVMGIWMILRYLAESQAVLAAAAAILIVLAFALYRRIVSGAFAVLAGVFAFLFLSALVIPYLAFLFVISSNAEPWRVWILVPMVCTAIYIWTLNLRLEAWAKELNAYERRKPQCHQCQYDLRGSLAAGSSSCPECGAPIRDEKVNAHAAATKAPAGEPS